MRLGVPSMTFKFVAMSAPLSGGSSKSSTTASPSSPKVILTEKNPTGCQCPVCSNLPRIPATSPRYSICSSDGDLSPACTTWNMDGNTLDGEAMRPNIHASYFDGAPFFDMSTITGMIPCLNQQFDPSTFNLGVPIIESPTLIDPLNSPSAFGCISTVATKTEVSKV